MYLIQPAVTATDAMLRAADGIMHVLKGQPSVKGETRPAVDLLLDIFKRVGDTTKSPMDIHQKDMASGRQQGQFRIWQRGGHLDNSKIIKGTS